MYTYVQQINIFPSYHDMLGSIAGTHRTKTKIHYTRVVASKCKWKIKQCKAREDKKESNIIEEGAHEFDTQN